MTNHYIFKRGSQYLNSRYQWGSLPDGFETWRKDALEMLFSKFPNPPTHYALVRSGFDLDNVEWVETT